MRIHGVAREGLAVLVSRAKRICYHAMDTRPHNGDRMKKRIFQKNCYIAEALYASMLVLAAPVTAQTYPNKPIRIITQEVGGSGDFMSRQIGQAISGPLAQPVIVDN